LAEKVRDDTDSLLIYAQHLSDNNFNPYSVRENFYKGDFINDVIERYMNSLSGYKIINKTFQLLERGADSDRPNNELIYLFVKNQNGVELGFQDVGSGISYILPILTSIWYYEISLIEQPELHLHPKAQCEIADAFIASSYYGASSIIETHSEHLLLRVARRIRETTNNNGFNEELKLQPQDVSIYYFDPQPDGTTKVKKIRLDKQGELLDLWPGGFFSERDIELFS
jgi:predicted ATPase